MPGTAQPPLSARTAQRIHEQVTREVFRLAGRDPDNHMECFKACIKTIENTKVIETTDYAIWESQEPIASPLKEFSNTNRTTKSGNFYTLSPTTVVAIAATLNLKHVIANSNVNNKHVVNTVSPSAVWAYLGIAINAWPQTGECQFFVKKSGEDSKSPTVGKITLGKFAVTTNIFGDTTTPLMLLTIARFNGWVKSAPGAPCLKKRTVDAPQIIHRRQALSEGKEILEKLGNRKFKQNDPALIREDADTELSVWKYMGKAGATLASLVSDEIDWIQLAQQVNDAESTAAVKKLVELSDKGAFLDMVSKMDVAVMSSLDLDLVRAKDRHQTRLNINDDLSYRNEIMANVAEAISRLERGSASQERLLRSKLCSIFDAADALILKENLPREISIVISTKANDE
ncbi:hypothetical protein FOXG_09316 [Fusarium oxysporum f. sp. lycopersici 4287]|uniref:Uncharacterized protein n=2 Tax=Fusarium oxysporum TaxID=5507 RepID=A0A0J9VAC6_FUSO4|nr:hypothetical protein FOXG_09316 [Fusarium oxysporum f. sp. lycopersici 4287]EXK37360.1 hypothetical protein FOMG_08139 [Fusarium oxysporum f. sp. melonis 26406]KNB08424.1 hypothetical protein FOXG_09316 [Fusarium oxysporum f. sp. lycopersici 4287]